jgi:flagellar hook-length control protein FliK
MNTNLLTIDNMLFAGTAVAAPPAPRPNAIKKATQFSPATDDTLPPPNTPELATTDNIHHITHNEPVNKPTEDFRHTLRKKETTEASQQDQDNTKPKEQSPAHPKAVQTDIVQGWLAQYHQTVQNGKEGLPKITDIKPKASYELAQLLTNIKADKSLPVTGQADKSAEIKLLVTTNKGQPGLKTVLPETSKGRPGLQTVLSNTPEGTAGTKPGQGNNIGKMLIPNSTVASTKVPSNGENAKELMYDALVDADGKTTATNEKTASVDTAVVAVSHKSSALSGKKLGTNVLVDDDSKTTNEETTMTDKSATPGNEKTAALSSNFPAVQTKLTESQSKPIGITPEKSTPVANKLSDSEAAAPEILSESSGGNGKESPRAGNKLSDNATVQDLNVTDVQVSTGQTKNRGGSTSNNSFNSDPEQILSHNNPQTPVTEQSPSSAEVAKSFNPPGQTSPSETYADIGKQILESIQKPLSQEGQDQQITVRLNPPELGKVFIKFQEQDDQIIGLLEVSKTQTRIEIQQALPQIIRSLQDSGIQIKRLDVVLSEEEQPEQEAFRDQSLQNGWAQQQDSTNSYMGGNNPNTNGVDEWLTNNNSYQNISELRETLITDGINMLA